MKKLFLSVAAIGTLLGVGALGVVGATTNAPESVAVKADSYSSEEISVVGKTSLSFNDGTFPAVYNWNTSKLCVSFEFVLPIPDGGLENGVKMILTSGGTKCYNENLNLVDRRVTGNITIDNINYNSTPVHLQLIDASANLFRAEIDLSELSQSKVIAGFEGKTLDGVSFIWLADGYNTPSAIRNARVTSARRSKIGDTPVEYSKLEYAQALRYAPNANTHNGVQDLPNIPNWYNSGLGLSLEFKPTEEKDSLISLRNGSNVAVHTGNLYYYRKNNSSAPSVGKIYPMADGWYRYEVMMSDFTPVTGKESEALMYFYLATWEADGYNCKPTFRDVKTITEYSDAAEASLANWATNSFNAKVGDVCDPDGKTDAAALNTTWGEVRASFAELSPAAQVAAYYDNVVVKEETKTALTSMKAKYEYVRTKYSLAPIFDSKSVASLTSSSLAPVATTINSNSAIVLAATATSLLAVGGAALFALKRKKAK